ncbi:TMEM98 (predicted) [Pycnogonum litorale]
MLIMETVVIVCVGILATVFVGSLVALIIVCKQKYSSKIPGFISRHTAFKSDSTLISGQESFHDVELDDVGLYPELDEILENEQWVHDTTGLIPHCLAILKTCHHLTERVVAMTIGNISPNAQRRLGEIIDAARKISPCVDDVVKSMYPPLDPRLLEARSSVLVLSVRYLALVTSSICQMPLAAKWIESKLQDMDEHLQVLKEAGLAAEASIKLQTLSQCNDVNQLNNNNSTNVNNILKDQQA